jgi:hypothetical protein
MKFTRGLMIGRIATGIGEVCRLAFVGVVIAAFFDLGTAGADATEQLGANSPSDPATINIDGLTMESKCSIFGDALRNQNSKVVDGGDQLIVLSVLVHFDDLSRQFDEMKTRSNLT